MRSLANLSACSSISLSRLSRARERACVRSLTFLLTSLLSICFRLFSSSSRSFSPSSRSFSLSSFASNSISRLSISSSLVTKSSANLSSVFLYFLASFSDSIAFSFNFAPTFASLFHSSSVAFLASSFACDVNSFSLSSSSPLTPSFLRTKLRSGRFSCIFSSHLL